MDNVTGLVTEVKAVRLTYYVRYETESEIDFANRWFISATNALLTYLAETGEEVRQNVLTSLLFVTSLIFVTCGEKRNN